MYCCMRFFWNVSARDSGWTRLLREMCSPIAALADRNAADRGIDMVVAFGQ